MQVQNDVVSEAAPLFDLNVLTELQAQALAVAVTIHRSEEPVAAHQLAVHHDLAIRRVEVILGGLRQAGLIRSPGGRRGGYRMTDGASQRPVIDYVRAAAMMSERSLPRRSSEVGVLVSRLAQRISEELGKVTLAQLAGVS